jgi:hypothetical protein
VSPAERRATATAVYLMAAVAGVVLIIVACFLAVLG